MKKFGMLVLVSFSLISIQSVAEAQNSPSTKLKAATKAVTGSEDGGKVQKGFSGRTSVPTDEAPAKKVTEKTAEVMEVSFGNDSPVNPQLVKSNQAKDSHIASGIQQYNLGNYEKASSEFRKALSYGKSDPYISTWLQASVNFLKIQELGLDLNSLKQK